MRSHPFHQDLLAGSGKLKVLRVLLTAAALALLPRPEAAYAQQSLPVSPLEIIVDASAGMRERMGDADAMVVAREFVRALRAELAAGGAPPPMGLRIYGGGSTRPGGECRDTRLAIPLSDHETDPAAVLTAATPHGAAPLAFALESALADTARAYVLITSGAEECGGDACAVWQGAVAGRAQRNRRARIHVVALGAKAEAAEGLRCLSRAGSGTFLPVKNRAAVASAARRLALILRNEGLLDVRLTVGNEESFTAPVRLLVPRTRQVAAAFNARGPRAVPAGIYDVVIETTPALPTRRVMILPGETLTIANGDFGRLEVEVRDAADRPVRVPITVQAPGRRSEVRYASTGDALVLQAGTYNVNVDLGDSVAARRNVAVATGRTTRVTMGGRGVVSVVSPEFPSPPPTRAILSRGATVDTLQVGESKSVATGRHRLRVETLPFFVSDDVTVATGETSVVELPPLGTLRFDLAGVDGAIAGQTAELREPLTHERYGALASGERRLVMPGVYRLELAVVPPQVVDEVVVQPGEETVVERRGYSRIVVAPPDGAAGAYRLEVLREEGGRRLGEKSGPAPALAAQPGVYFARVWRGTERIWEGRVTVASDKPARIDLPRP